MTYATLDGLAARYGTDLLIQLTDRASPPAGTVDPSVIDRALTDTDAQIDSALAVRYRLPLAQVPAVIVDLALVLAIHRLHRFEPDPKIKDDRAQALKDLDAIAAGRRRLDVAGIEPVGNGSGGVRTSDRPRDMTPDNLSGLI